MHIQTNDDKQQFTALRSVAPVNGPITPDASSYHAPENGNCRISVQVQIPECGNTETFGSLPLPHLPIQPLNSVQVNGGISHSKTFHSGPRIPESANSCPFGGVPVSHQPTPVNSVPQLDGAVSQKAFHLRPPHPAPSNQFSYVHADQRTQMRENHPQSYHSRSHFVQNTERGNFYGDHDRFEAAPHDADNWRHSEPSFSGTQQTQQTNVNQIYS